MTFPARASSGGGKGRLPGAIAQVRPRPPPHTTGLTWGRGYRRRRAYRRTRRASQSAPTIADPDGLPAGGWALRSAPRDTLQTLPGDGHGRRGGRFPGRIPLVGG